MAADQRRKRLSGASIVGFSSREHHRSKKKKMDSSDKNLNPRAHVSLEWDGSQKRVVARKNQIGLSLRHMRSFIDHIPRRNSFLADVCIVPQEIFDLKNLTDVLSNEVWQTHLSEAERNFLRQFLPGEADEEQVVEALLAGDDFHFGNPSLEWGAAVCSGNLHPDSVTVQEQRLKAEKRAYYSHLQKYHHGIIDHLQGLKGKWESCRDSEKETLLMMSSRRDSTRAIDGNQDFEQDMTAASESCSWNDANEKPCSSENHNSSPQRGGEHRKRIFEKRVENKNYGNPSVGPDNMQNTGTRGARKKEKLPKLVQHTDGAEYMSYLKISKKQHQIVTSMKQSDKSIQSKSLNCILGNINKLDVQPYEVFVEEEQKKLHLHWSQLAKDLPSAYEFWKEMQLQKREIIKSLERDLKDYLETWVEDEQKLEAENFLQKDDTENRVSCGSYLDGEDGVKGRHKSPIQFQNQSVVEEVEYESNLEDSGDSGQGSPQNKSSTFQVPSSHGVVELKDMEDDEDSDPDSPSHQSSPQVCSLGGSHDIKAEGAEDKSSSDPSLSQDNKPPPQISSLTRDHHFNLKDVEDAACVGPSFLQDQTLTQVSAISDDSAINLSDNVGMTNGISELENAPFVMTEPSRNAGIASSSSCGGPFSSVTGIWPAVNTGGSYKDSTSSRQVYSSNSSRLLPADPLGNQEHLTGFVGLESNMNKEDGMKSLLQRQSNNGSFGSFINQDRNDLLQTLYRNQGLSSNNQEQLQSLFQGMPSHNQNLGFQPPNSVSMEDVQFSNSVQEQTQPLHPLAQEQKRPGEIYMQANISENVYCDRNRYFMPGPAGAQDWNVGHMRMAVPMQSRINSNEILNRNWLPGENQLQSMWSSGSGSNGVGIPTQGIQSDQGLTRGSNSDQTLFSVLSQCNQLQSRRPPFHSASSTEQQFITPRNYGMMMDTAMPRISGTLPTAANPLDYMSGSNPAASLTPDNNLGWINPPNQNPPARRDHPLGKLYPGSWNQ